ncbi:hypothetical protein Pmar_PMAR000089 [Perkinsus marinus ATCC 50983]|uniref:FAD/NAD(P)-binding domain-containing protein n=1 Tax=Perkinsus marinus (strain ATCC 50983 / TXsc) TaxID=423536 RepID=C5KPV5_PERM5|nr:hypothetical protein Pmar_PMAR000089 [Perkinsus marinus ATCC 50983]EER13502.1 hypothetical protein Pmar_PMAR000089 [Perkinsus marinus ATCC 50983]|eukprot:XP_002781707.1 hypothetical protein Pmar_PMAR000089 [Perkinsus marinus ATCC 50983]
MLEKRRVLIVGGGFSGLFAASELASRFEVTLVDAKEYFEYTPGVLRAFVHPGHHYSLTFIYSSVLEGKMGCKFIFGEVKTINGLHKYASVKPMFSCSTQEVYFDYCIIASGCNFGVMNKWGASLWFPTIHEDAREESHWKHLDERFLSGRRLHIVEEHEKLKELNERSGSVLVVGGGFIGVEWVTELQHYFPNLKLHIVDSGPKCLGPLPERAAEYCEAYMRDRGIKISYGRYKDDPAFYRQIGMENQPDSTFVCIGVKASNYFMPPNTLTSYNPDAPDKIEKDPKKCGPCGGGWIRVNKKLQVLQMNDDHRLSPFGGGCIFAVGDCNLCPDLPPIPKISYPAEEQASHACCNIRILDSLEHKGASVTRYCGLSRFSDLRDTWKPKGAGTFATSLGPSDACLVMGASEKGKGKIVLSGRPSAALKDFIEYSKVKECKSSWLGKFAWHFVHRTPFVNY